MSQTKGVIFNIVRSSLVDGDGVRTTVFLKGCPLRCLWCCNSEGQSTRVELKVSPDLCSGCGRCYDVCERQAMIFNGGLLTEVDRTRCDVCGKCADVCLTEAIDMFGKEYTVDEVYEIVARDKDYYDASCGGVTIGGGEATMQAKFTAELIDKCHENGIHAAIDTCGYTLSEESARLLEKADLLLFDLKGLDPDIHKTATGVSNELILQNLRHLCAIGKDIIIRLPIIPGYTDSDDNIRKTASLLKEFESIRRVDLIAYHDFGKIKFTQRGVPYPLEGLEHITTERIDNIKSILEESGLNIQVGG